MQTNTPRSRQINIEPWPTGHTCMEPVGGTMNYWGNARDLSGARQCGKPVFVTWRDPSGATDVECIDGHCRQVAHGMRPLTLRPGHVTEIDWTRASRVDPAARLRCLTHGRCYAECVR